MSDVFAALSWWLVLQLLAFSAVPLAFRLFRWLPDRGYSLSKALGLLLSSYLFWLLNSLGFLRNSPGGMLLAAGLVATFSIWVYRTRAAGDVSLREWLRQHRSMVLAVELLLLLAFCFWAVVRAYSPEIVATEKPMDLAFINAIGRSEQFPPLDPWLSGFAISYYYFGYLITAAVSQLAGVPGTVAFNLGQAWLFAGTLLGGFGLAFNLIAAARQDRPSLRQPIGFGLLGGLMVGVMGNLEGVLEVLHVNAILPAGFWKWLDIVEINTPPPEVASWPPRGGWWWWRASRVIHDRGLDGKSMGVQPIDEFPFFSFLLGDMHPHVLALPFVFLALGLALNWWLKRWQVGSGGENSLRDWLRSLVREADPPFLAVYAVCLGALGFLNTWDFPFYWFVTVGSLALALYRTAGRLDWRLIVRVALAGGGLLAAGILAYLPFYLGFRSQAGGILPNIINPTWLPQFFVMFGPFLFILLLWLGDRLWHLPVLWRTFLWTTLGLLAVLLLAVSVFGAVAAISPAAQGVLGQAAEQAGSMAAALRETMLIRLTNPWTALLLLAMIGFAVALWQAYLGRPEGKPLPLFPQGGVAPFVLLLVLTAALLTLAPEFVYLKDNFGARMNTIFKFYYQAWVMWGIASAYALYALLQRPGRLRWIAGVGAVLLILAGMFYPALSIPTRANNFASQPTLDGMTYMAGSQPADYAAIRWLQDNVQGAPVVLEAVGGQYSSGGRIATHTGLPTVLGWAGHEYQWRGETPEPGIREPDIDALYTSRMWSETQELLDKYRIKYVVVGPLEVSTYGQPAALKFERALETVFQADGVKIYRWDSPNQ